MSFRLPVAVKPALDEPDSRLDLSSVCLGEFRAAAFASQLGVNV